MLQKTLSLQNNRDPAASGASLALPVQVLMESPAELDDLAREIRRQVNHGLAVNLMVSDLGHADAAIGAFEDVLRRLTNAGVVKSSLIGVCLNTPVPPLRPIAILARCWLGDGPRFVQLAPSELRHQDTGTATPVVPGVWDYLWRRRDSSWAFWPAYSSCVHSMCPLLSDESATCIVPPFGTQVPAGSAWLPMRVHLPHYADAAGDIDFAALDDALQQCVETGEQLLDLANWPTANMFRDAQMNRRLAILVTGFGDLVQLHGSDPSDIRVLQSLLKLSEHTRMTLWNRSAEMARHSELLPAIARTNPAMAQSDGIECPVWSSHWQAAVERTAVRHRSLLVMSPYSVLPAAGGCARFTDLLPIIACADAYSFSNPGPFAGWNCTEFRRFHRRAWAIIQRRNSISLVATRA